MSKVSLAIRVWRERRGLSQQELAAAVNVRQATISDLETGRAKVLRLALLGALADALQCSARALIVEEEAKPRPPPKMYHGKSRG